MTHKTKSTVSIILGTILVLTLAAAGTFLSQDIAPPVQTVEKNIDNARFKK